MKRALVYLFTLFITSCVGPEMKKIAEKSEIQKFSNQLAVGRLISQAQRKFDSKTQFRVEKLPNIPFHSLEATLEDALTAFLCHKNPGGGESKILTIAPVYTFTKYTDEENNSIILGEDLSNFLNSCIDSVMNAVLSNNFDTDGRKMITSLELESMNETAHGISFGIRFLLLNQNSEYSTTGIENNGPGILWENCPFSNNVSWDVTSGIHRIVFDLALNNPQCNIYLRFRQRSSFPLSDHSIHPPHPSSYGQMLLPGFVWKLVYQGLRTSTPTNPSSSDPFSSFYTSYGIYNFWNNVNFPNYLTGNQLNNVARGVIYQGINPQYYPFVANKWDIMSINANNAVFSGPFWLGGIGEAISVNYVWSQWKWIAVPDPNYWNAINYEDGITSLLNP